MMKKLFLASLALLFVLAATSFGGILSDDEGELSVQGTFFLPDGGDFDLFKSGFGGEVSYREWVAFPWGLGLSLGYANWQTDKDSRHSYKIPNSSDFHGTVSTLPLGINAYFNIIDWDNWNVILKTGFSYVFVESDVDFYYNGSRHDIDMDNAILWDIALEYDHTLTENLYLTLTGGFQTDLMKADSKFSDSIGRHNIHDTSFEAFFARAGLKFLF